MTQFQSTPNLAKAVIALIKAVGPIAKTMDIGTGANSFKGVADKDVKDKVGQALADNGLCLLPVDVIPTESVHVIKNKYGDEKLNSFTSVLTKYLLLHESGESIVLTGYGHGVDTQDKAAGKATTYALKYLLLYLSMAPTGTIDEGGHDSDGLPPKTVVPPGAVPNRTTPPPSAAQDTKADNEKAVQNFEKEAKAPAQSPADSAPSNPTPSAPAGKHNLVVDDEKWPRVLDWVIMNKGRGLQYIVTSLKKNNEFGSDVESALQKAIE